MLEFLGLSEPFDAHERKLETLLVSRLRDFLMELGKGFSFVGRQFRISTETTHFYDDLVFYDLELLRESIDLECKLALGHDGQSALPEDFWPTYSAFADTDGGVVILGVRERKGRFLIEGIDKVDKIRKDLFDALNNRQKVSANLLTDADMRDVSLDGRTLLIIEIPRANRKQRPLRVVTHARIREMTALHPFDITRMLQGLVQDGFLEAHNPGRGSVYCLPRAALPKPEEVFGDGSAQLTFSSAHLSTRSAHLRPDSEALPTSRETYNEHRDLDGRLLADQLDAPVIDSLDKLDAGFHSALELLATQPRTKGKLPADSMKRVALALCHGH
ncbi:MULTISPECIES: PDDEXK nuclease domain-containing protein [unclassified Thiocapsa]|uniref:PDDEXK nuclease domain-containing protein n=1 Tax=unclassified Thiocapsa TaxID=2641286 RepID=UPI0035ADEA9A